MATQIRLRRDTRENWLIVDPILAQGEMGVEIDYNGIKIGNGINPWSELDYAGGGGLLSILYDELLSTISSSGLTAGNFYRISDFRTVHWMVDSENNYILDEYDDRIIHGGELEPLIVLAISPTSISTEAWSEKYPTDYIRYDWNFENYINIPNFVNNGNPVDGWKGVITRREDTLLNNRVNFDFREITYRLWNVSQIEWESRSGHSWASGEYTQHDGVIYIATDSSIGIEPGVNLYWKEYWLRLINLEDFDNAYLGFETNSMNRRPPGRSRGIRVLDIENYIDRKMFLDNNDSENIYFEESLNLPYTIFGESCYGNNFGAISYANIISSNSINNSTGNYSTYNYLGKNCYGNNFGHFTFINAIGSNCIFNEIGSYCGYNVLGSYCISNNIGNFNIQNSLGNYNFNNKIGGEGGEGDEGNYEGNVLGDYNTGNVFGDKCYGNYLGNYCTGNTFGSNNSYNYLLDESFGNIVGNGGEGNIFSSYNYYNVLGNNCNFNFFSSFNYDNTIGDGGESNEFGEYSMFNTLGNNNYYNIIGGEGGEGGEYNSFGDNSGNNTIGIGGEGNKFGDANYDNVLGLYNYYNTLGIGCSENTFPHYAVLNELKNGVENQNYIYSDQVYADVTHQITNTGDVYQTYINTSGATELVIRDNLVGAQSVPMILTFNDIYNAAAMIGGNPTDVSLWNTFFSEPNSFSRVVVESNTVYLYPVGYVTLRQSIFDNQYGSSLLSFDDGGYVNQVSLNAFGKFENSFGCPNLTSVSFRNLDSIPDYCFFGCTSLSNVNFGNLKNLGNYSFSECSITSMNSNIVYIGEGCFQYCSNLTSVNIDSVYTLNDRCFQYCYSLTSVSSDILYSAGNFAFHQCENLSSVSFPSLYSAGGHCFGRCYNLNNISFPLLRYAGERCFQRCESLVNIDCQNLYQIGNNCFQYCESLININFPKLKYIGDYAFSQCTSLTYITISSCVSLGTSEIDNYVFEGISGNFISLVIPCALNTDDDVIYLIGNNTVNVVNSDEPCP